MCSICSCSLPLVDAKGRFQNTLAPTWFFDLFIFPRTRPFVFWFFFEPLPFKTKLSRNETEPWDWVVACFAPKLALDCLDRANHFGWKPSRTRFQAEPESGTSALGVLICEWVFGSLASRFFWALVGEQLPSIHQSVAQTVNHFAHTNPCSMGISN